jgi:phospholipid-translocating ATPase
MMFDYSYITLYNLVFTSLPCIFAGVLDQDLKADYSFKFPQLYLMGIRNDKFKSSRFYLTVLDAIYQSAICFGVPYLVFVGGKMSSTGYDTEGVYELGTFIAGIAVIIANALVGFTIFSWTWVMVLVIVISSATFFIWTGVYAQILTFTFYGEDMLFREGAFWLCLIITFVICMLPRFITKYYLHMEHPFDNDIVRETVLCNNNKSDTSSHLWQHYKAKKQHRKTLLQSEEEMPITLMRTQSAATTDTTPSSHALAEPAPAYPRDAKRMTGNSEIMYMRSGHRTSFTGFAYSSDDASAFDAFRSSVYRNRTSGNRHSYAGTMMTTTTKDDGFLPPYGAPTQDWMPLDRFKLRRYETEPHHSVSKKPAWVRAVQQRISPPKPITDHELVDISH